MDASPACLRGQKGQQMLHLMNLLYVGPDQILPLTSILGAIGGALLIFWRHVVSFFKKIGSLFSKKKSPAEGENTISK
jgi:hypothetical protein